MVSSIVSLVAIGLFSFLVYLFAPQRAEENKRALVVIIASIFIVFNVAYFANLIPPVPLALRDIGIYHSVERTSSDIYSVVYEEGKWYEPFKHSDDIFHLGESSSVFCFSSVFAPARLSAPIYHRWEYYDEESRAWTTTSRIPFVLSGGREKGFRGYSEIASIFPGKWRCSVETERGALIGRQTFRIVSGKADVELVAETR